MTNIDIYISCRKQQKNERIIFSHVNSISYF